MCCSSESPVLWVRIDPDVMWLRHVTFEQPDYMWQYQLRHERDVMAQSQVRSFDCYQGASGMFRPFLKKKKKLSPRFWKTHFFQLASGKKFININTPGVEGVFKIIAKTLAALSCLLTHRSFRSAIYLNVTDVLTFPPFLQCHESIVNYFQPNCKVTSFINPLRGSILSYS